MLRGSGHVPRGQPGAENRSTPRHPRRDPAITEENLVESNLTTGGYDQALAGALKLLEDPLGVNMTLNMKFFVAAALYMKGDAAAGREAIDDLDAFQRANPTRDRNTWSYSGTRRYIAEREGLEAGEVASARTIARIEANTGQR